MRVVGNRKLRQHVGMLECLPKLSPKGLQMDFIFCAPIAAIEYSLIYILGGGGLIGALVIYMIARLLRR